MRKIVVAVTGASGSLYAARLLHHLEQLAQQQPLEVGVVLSKNAPDVWLHELARPFETPFKVWDRQDYFAPFASGSARYQDMVIAPCSMGTLARIAHGLSDDLITRAADVILKERRRLICIPRDTPMSAIHLENMLKLTQLGATMLPAAPSFYSHPATFEDLADTVIHRALDHMGLPVPRTYRWAEPDADTGAQQGSTAA